MKLKDTLFSIARNTRDNLSLYFRNVKGVFLTPFSLLNKKGYNPHEHAIMLLLIVHICFLPITLVVIPFIKTLFDVFTRKRVPDDVISTTNSNIDSMNSEQLQRVVDNVLGYDAKSSSSQKLKIALRSSQCNASSEQDKLVSQKKWDLICGQLSQDLEGQDPTTVYTKEHIEKTPLSKQNESELDSFSATEHQELAGRTAAQQKELLTTFLSQSKNAGKRMQHIIIDNSSIANQSI
jgi:hypothetical protein